MAQILSKGSFRNGQLTAVEMTSHMGVRKASIRRQRAGRWSLATYDTENDTDWNGADREFTYDQALATAFNFLGVAP